MLCNSKRYEIPLVACRMECATGVSGIPSELHSTNFRSAVHLILATLGLLIMTVYLYVSKATGNIVNYSSIVELLYIANIVVINYVII